MLNNKFTSIKYILPKKQYTSIDYLVFGGIVIYLILINIFNNSLKNEDLKFLLYPIQFIVSLSTGIPFKYYSEYGYVQIDGLIRINNSCSGFIFFNVLISIGYVTLYLKGLASSGFKKIFAIFIIVPVLSYLMIIIANTSRIILGIKLQLFSLNNSWFPNHFIHEIFGVMYFLIFSIIFYLIIHKTINTWNN